MSAPVFGPSRFRLLISLLLVGTAFAAGVYADDPPPPRPSSVPI
ncbi:MAG: hypothetical protein AAF481_17320 [Acidobacteriota bacterium]